MRIGAMAAEGTGDPPVPGMSGPPGLNEITENAQRFEALGLDTAWIANIEIDAVTASAVVGTATTRIEIATGVTPTPMRHPFALAQQAATAQAACGGRFTLGIGLCHQGMVENLMGLSYARPARQMREYLEIAGPMLFFFNDTATTEIYTTRWRGLSHAPPTEIIVAAMGPIMLGHAGRLARGTFVWATGLNTLADYVVPTINAAAEAAGRPAPRVAAGFPISVTDDAQAGYEAAARTFAHYKDIPSYRGMLDREGKPGVEDLAITGNEAAVAAQLERIRDTGTTDFVAFIYDTDDQSRARTEALLGELSGNS
ncbi:MAG: TIGR03564 family F420-dependent LLM class oxidoreductase [bacterium]|nr:TIGR03564 family F420-dependent LLM class oxidoreductase [bacterium]